MTDDLTGQAATGSLADRLYAELDRAHRCRQVWIMNPDWYKQVRRTAASQPDGEEDEATWAPSAGDRMFALRIVVRGDGGEPHIEWLTPEEIGQ